MKGMKSFIETLCNIDVTLFLWLSCWLSSFCVSMQPFHSKPYPAWLHTLQACFGDVWNASSRGSELMYKVWKDTFDLFFLLWHIWILSVFQIWNGHLWILWHSHKEKMIHYHTLSHNCVDTLRIKNSLLHIDVDVEQHNTVYRYCILSILFWHQAVWFQIFIPLSA